ncbi:putative glucan 1,3-alpha-glucosidase isoform X1 [Sesbania bispinosa]|nr:putative glucan 1,3-alpha-glucosidase isoform X1 [Sesbania bispinosa]
MTITSATKATTGDGDGGKEDPSFIVYLSDNYAVVLYHNPFNLFTLDEPSGHRVASLNSYSLFDFK